MDESDPDLYVTNDHMTQMIAESPDKPIFPYLPDYLINRRIKEIGKKCNIDTAELQRKEYGGNVESVYTEKYKTLSCHTARRTFITIAINNDMNPLVIMEITGHKAYKTMKRYMKVTEDTKRREMEKWGKRTSAQIPNPKAPRQTGIKEQQPQPSRYKRSGK